MPQIKSLRIREREKAIVGFNRKKRGKPCYQWNVAFVCQEAVPQHLAAGNTHCRSVLLELLDDVRQKLDTDLMILRLDGGYLSGDILNTRCEMGLQIIITCRYDWILSQGVALSEPNWQQTDENTRLYDVGNSGVVSTCCHTFR